MARKKANIHYIYKTTCNVTGRWYVGMHSTCKLDDGYMGSGTILRRSIRKYGKENHAKEILEYLPTREELVLREIEIVNKELISDGLCMNLKEGGQGGFSTEEQQKNCSKAGGRAKKNRFDTDETFRLQVSQISSETMKKNNLNNKMNSSKFKDKKHSDETKQKMSESRKGNGIGETNSQYGTCWITNEIENKKIYKGDEIPDGWRLGRVTNKYK